MSYDDTHAFSLARKGEIGEHFILLLLLCRVANDQLVFTTIFEYKA